jgi:hypothetical protein
MARCYHRVCGRHFGGVTAFDRHLMWSRVAPHVTCVEPEGVGLVSRDGLWGMPTPATVGAR